MNTLEIDTLLKKHPHSRPVFKGVYAITAIFTSFIDVQDIA
jgi:hypothetical protein